LITRSDPLHFTGRECQSGFSARCAFSHINACMPFAWCNIDLCDVDS